MTKAQRGVTPIDGERRFRMAFDAAAVGIALVDLTGRMVECNGALHDMLGYAPGELRGKTFPELADPAEVGDPHEPLADVLADRRDSCVVERRFLRKNGSLVWIKLTASLVRDAGHAPRYGIGIVTDITDQKTLKDQFLHSQKLATIGRLAGGVAQDFNNVLTVMHGYSQFIIEATPDDDVRRAYADEIRRSAEQASVLTRHLLALVRQRPRRPTLLDANHVIRDLEKTIDRVIGDDISLSLMLSDEPATVLADAGQLQQVLLNLVVNARDAMPVGGALLIETDVEIVVPDDSDDAPFGRKHVRISITDTGAGVPEDVQRRMFEPFFSTRDSSDALGLGLAAANTIVKDAGGMLRLRADPCRNTTFDVLLPSASEPFDNEPSPPAEPVERNAGHTILLVEDERAVRRVAARALEDAGYRVLSAGSGEEALEIANGFPDAIYAVVTDVVMPGMTGTTLAARLETMRPDIRVLYMSGHSESMLARFGIHEEKVELLRKPFTPHELASRIQALR